jgi:hypothetical protein
MLPLRYAAPAISSLNPPTEISVIEDAMQHRGRYSN